jgi:hypothetical protein
MAGIYQTTKPRERCAACGKQTLFDSNFQAMGVSSEECFALAHEQELKPNKLLQVHMAEHWKRSAMKPPFMARRGSGRSSDQVMR